MTLEESKKIFVDNRIIGKVEDDVFYRTISGAKHLLRSPRAIAVNVEALKNAQAFGAKWMQVFDRDSKITYYVRIEKIFSKGFLFDRGWGIQIGLTFENWDVISIGEPNPRQLGLWKKL